ncbi:MAG: efflux RND transporter periplasmic adaptor subunit [Candidatus Melainabacteria bacterium]|nr:efflux RND transporter periplasmic adaptor subunit [Candidatus Melainabacteria bacterium]
MILNRILSACAAVCLLASCGQEAKKEGTDKKTEQRNANVPSKDVLSLSREAQSRIGLSVIQVKSRIDDVEFDTTGEIKADENRVFHINSLTNGRVVKDSVMLGDLISPGQKLAVVQNLEVAKIYANYIHQRHENEIQMQMSKTRLALARKNFDRLKRLFNEKIAAEKDYIKAESDLKLEEETLFGLQEHLTHLKEETRALLSAYGAKLPSDNRVHVVSESPITTPRGGMVIKKNVTVGDVVNSSDPLYVVGDLSQVWLNMAVYDKQLEQVKEGCAVTFTSDSLPGKIFHGKVSYIKPGTEDVSGTFVARAILSNPKLELKPGMLGQSKISQTGKESFLFVPEEAVQKFAEQTFVFIKLGTNEFKKIDIQIAKRIPDGFLVKSGVNEGDSIVVKGSFELKSEMLKDAVASGED